MILDLELVQTLGAERVLMNLLSREARSFGAMRAVVDTGSPRTIISARDAYGLRIPVTNLPRAPPTRGFGRGALPCKMMKRFRFAVRSRDQVLEEFEMPVEVVDYGALQGMHQSFRENAFQLPTIIGLDFLRLLRFRLCVDLHKREAFLDRVG